MSNSQRTSQRLDAFKLILDFFLSTEVDQQAPATELVELNGIEPMTSCLQSRRSPN
jgi:hypothetical protein